MSTVEVCLFDVSRQALVPVEQGSIIWVRAELSQAPFDSLTVPAARASVAFELLHRVLEYEGRSGRFVIEPFGEECTLLKAFGELEPREERRLYNDPGGRRFSAQVKRAQHRIQVLLAPEEPIERAPEKPTNGPSGAEPSEVATTVADVVSEHGWPVLLMHLLSAHYAHPLGDLAAGIREGSARVERIREVASELDADSPGPEDMEDRMRAFRVALARDLDTPTALRVLFEWLRAAELRPDRIGDSHLQEMLALLSLDELLDDLRC
jgi:hypothetical protein